METLRRLIGRISQQIQLLNPSQKVAIALCAVIVAGSLVWLLNWSTTPYRVPLLAQDLSFAELDSAEGALQAAGVNFETHGQRIYVHPKDQANAIRLLSRADALPQDTTVGFAALIEEDSAFRSESENAFRRRVALGHELEKVIATAPEVTSARVLIQMERERRLNAPNTQPTASVMVTMAPGHQMAAAKVESLARLVAGAVPDLKPHNVTVVDAVTLHSYGLPDPDDLFAADMLDKKKQEEGHLLGKILNQLAYIPGVLAGVTVELDGRRRTIQSNVWADPQPKVEETRSYQSSAQDRPGETGTNPNVGIALAGAGEATGSHEKEQKTEFYDAKPKETTVTEDHPFHIKRVTAAINIPRSFFVSVFKAQPGNAEKEPVEGDAVFEAIKSRQVDHVREQVKNIIMAESDDDVKVESYYDFDPGTSTLRSVPGGMVQAGITDGEGTVSLLRSHGSAVGLSVLALVALGLMVMIVRKSGRAAARVPSARGRPPEDADLITGPDGLLRVPGVPVGRADMPEGLLQGQEVDDDTLRVQQLGEQVSKMVDENPAVAAELLRRWVGAE
jgi:flagellar M-ring protein FliF